ncbi:MAG: hypothetical protein R3A13_02075 [Bdellovibrionota bacterium]
MAANNNRNTSDLDKLRDYRRGSFTKYLLWAVLLAVISSFTFLSSIKLDKASLDNSIKELHSSGSEWGRDLVQTYQSQRNWLKDHGTNYEVRLYDKISTLILSSRGGVREPVARSLAENVSAKFGSGSLRAVFMIIASLRLWLFAIIVTFIWNFYSLKDYRGNNLLGQTGNGRLFYSGIKVGLKETAEDGTPSKSVIGLACPPMASDKEVSSSYLLRVLKRWGAVNDTNKALASIILAHNNWPAFVETKENAGKLEKIYKDQGLIHHAGLILDQALMLVKKYKDQDEFNLDVSDDPSPSSTAYTPEDYAQNLGQMMHRVLTPSLQKSLGTLKSEAVASCILAFEAGKSLAYHYAGGQWRIKSNFPQLSARAVIHSLPSYGTDYNLLEKATIRRALVYAARRSHFGPVRFPVDLSEESRALRQWVELCMATPVDLAETSDDVELFGLVCQGYQRWCDEFYKDIASNDSQEIFATKTNLLFVPVSRLVRQAAKALNIRTIGRIDSLVQKLSIRQRAYEKKLANSSEEDGFEAIPIYDKILPPLTKEQITSLAKMHGASPKDLRIWSSVRMILSAHGWLSRRVGDYSVPEDSVIFAVLRTGREAPGANEHGLIGKPAMVPLRGYKLEYELGRAWQKRFPLSFTATMAESKDVFDKLMQGKTKEEILGIDGAA